MISSVKRCKQPINKREGKQLEPVSYLTSGRQAEVVVAVVTTWQSPPHS